MPLQFVRNDITRMRVDAIVLPANPKLEQGDGTSEAIYRAAGQQLVNELRLKYPDGCEIGKAVITYSYKAIQARYIIHAVCPQWLGGHQGEREFLHSAYKESLLLAKKNKCNSIAFPLLSTGNYKFPKMEAIRIAINTIFDFLSENEMDVYIVLFTAETVEYVGRLFGEVLSFIDDEYVENALRINVDMHRNTRAGKFDHDDWYDQRAAYRALLDEPQATAQLHQVMARKKETFHEMLFRRIRDSGMTDAEVYKAAQLTRQHFNKIKNNDKYLPKKRTILALAFALHLNTTTAMRLLHKAGYALSDSDDFDKVMKFCLDSRTFNLDDVDQMLIAYDLQDEVFLEENKPRGKRK